VRRALAAAAALLPLAAPGLEPRYDHRDAHGPVVEMLGAFEGSGLSIEYIYPLVAGHRGKTAVLLLRVEDPDKAAGLLAGRKVRVLTREEAFAAVGA
jgi:hypothetical protein